MIDALANDELLTYCREDARIIHAGKRSNRHAMTQDEINDTLVREASAGSLVVRLKGGDPFVFGRGGEEAAALRAAGIAFEVVPGVTSAVAAPAYAGIPVTHRGVATAVLFVTAHESDATSGIDWNSIAGFHGTRVFLMGLSNLPEIAAKLIEAGADPKTPAAVISNGTQPSQRTAIGDLSSIAERAVASALTAPAVIVVGEVVRLRESISWFETKPLFGRRAIVTRSRSQASTLAELLQREGALVETHSLIEIQPPESFEPLDRAIAELQSFQRIVFSSTNGVDDFFTRLARSGGDTRTLGGVEVAAVGRMTAAALRSHGINADIVPGEFRATAILPLLSGQQEGIRTLVVRAEEGSEDLITGLRDRGGVVTVVAAYRTVKNVAAASEIGSRLVERLVDVITFTSGSTVDALMTHLAPDEAAALRAVCVASIGPVTTEALRRYGISPTLQAPEATIESLAEAVVAHFRR